MTTLSHKSVLIRNTGIFLLSAAVCSLATAVCAEDKKAPTEQEQQLVAKIELKKVDMNSFEYQLEGRHDPFVPFITPKVTSVDMNAIVDNKDVLSGMQLFEPGQLSLVAIMQMSDKHVAMVQDSTGKGYVISENMKIGRRGVIKRIIPNRVIIEETAVTRAGKEMKNNIEMILKKEGEE